MFVNDSNSHIILWMLMIPAFRLTCSYSLYMGNVGILKHLCNLVYNVCVEVGMDVLEGLKTVSESCWHGFPDRLSVLQIVPTIYLLIWTVYLVQQAYRRDKIVNNRLQKYKIKPWCWGIAHVYASTLYRYTQFKIVCKRRNNHSLFRSVCLKKSPNLFVSAYHETCGAAFCFQVYNFLHKQVKNGVKNST